MIVFKHSSLLLFLLSQLAKAHAERRKETSRTRAHYSWLRWHKGTFAQRRLSSFFSFSLFKFFVRLESAVHVRVSQFALSVDPVFSLPFLHLSALTHSF